MKEIKNEALQYYCNGIGEIHECGKRMLDSVDELPLSLQRPYQEYWTDEWSLCCYIVFLDRQPGILICAEYDAYVRFQKEFGGGDYSDTISQFKNVRELMFDEDKKLYYHGCDCSKTAFWADKETGRSKNFWLRAIGWFCISLVDNIDYIDDEDERKKLCAIFAEAIEGIAQYADAETGMYYQVVDQGGREGNYPETSGSSMIAYAMMKGARLGVVDKKYAELGKKTFDGICEKYLSVNDEGDLNLGGICLVAGLGPEDNRRRDGSYEYYISEPVVENDAKGVAPFVLCYTEVMRTGR